MLAGIVVITTLEWHSSRWYSLFTTYGTLITFIFLCLTLLCYVDIVDLVRDKEFWFIGVTSVIALINLFVIHSSKGAILIVVDFLLILYLSDKVKFTKIQSLTFLLYIAFFFFYWTVDVKGYFKGYNTNYGGLILITGFACLMILMEILNIRLKISLNRLKVYEKAVENVKEDDKGSYVLTEAVNYGKTKQRIKYVVFILLWLFFVALAYNIISWYRSRTALVGLTVLLIIKLIPTKVISNKYVYTLINLFSTIGAVVFTGIYMMLGKLTDFSKIQLFYKDLVSGRNEIWSELWEAFFQSPITGIGSSYEMKLEFMEGLLEAHSGMFDILVIHGIIVFIAVVTLFIKRLMECRKNVAINNVSKMVYAAIICMLVTGFFENFYIVQPFSLILLSLFATLNMFRKAGSNKVESNKAGSKSKDAAA